MPDVSHLSEAERAVLQEVWRRQKEEEDKLRDANRYALKSITHPPNLVHIFDRID